MIVRPPNDMRISCGPQARARANLRSTDRPRRSVPERSSGPTGPSAACAG